MDFFYQKGAQNFSMKLIICDLNFTLSKSTVNDMHVTQKKGLNLTLKHKKKSNENQKKVIT